MRDQPTDEIALERRTAHIVVHFMPAAGVQDELMIRVPAGGNERAAALGRGDRVIFPVHDQQRQRKAGGTFARRRHDLHDLRAPAHRDRFCTQGVGNVIGHDVRQSGNTGLINAQSGG
jgi:hypothetical protein